MDNITKINANELYELGIKYYYGNNQIEKNLDFAFQLFNESLNKGETKAKIYIAKCFYYGKGTVKNYEKAYSIFNELINDTNDAEAKYYISLMYYYGYYVKKDYEKAYNLFNELVEQYDDIYSKYYIALMYYYGYYVEKDYEKAYNLFSELADKYNDEYAIYMLGTMYYNGEFVEKNQNKAIAFYELSAKQNHKESLIELGYIYYKKELYKKALEYFKKIKNKDLDGQILFYIGECNNKLGKCDEALKFYKLSAEHGNSISKIKLAENYMKNEEWEKAIEIYKNLLNDENELIVSQVEYALGLIYYYADEQNINIKCDKKLGLQYLKSAVNKKHEKAIQEYSKIIKIN